MSLPNVDLETKINLRTEGAYTLVEMMTVLLVVGVLLTLAYPSIQQAMYAWESKRTEKMFVEVLRQAKVESFSAKHSVVICSVDRADLTLDCDRHAQGRVVVFSDYDENAKLDGQDRLLYEQNWKLRFGTLRLHAGNRTYVRYYGTGKPRGHFGHLKYCSESGNPNHTFKVIFNQHGRVTVKRQSEEEVGC